MTTYHPYMEKGKFLSSLPWLKSVIELILRLPAAHMKNLRRIWTRSLALAATLNTIHLFELYTLHMSTGCLPLFLVLMTRHGVMSRYNAKDFLARDVNGTKSATWRWQWVHALKAMVLCHGLYSIVSPKLLTSLHFSLVTYRCSGAIY